MIKQPNSRHCFACGVDNRNGLQLTFHIVAPGEVMSNYIVPEKFQGYPGLVQGGIVATMLDEITLRAHLQEEDFQQTNFLFTARLDIRYRKPVPVGQPIKIIGKAIKRKSKTAVSKGFIYGVDGELLAEADAILVQVPEAVMAKYTPEELGWMVYPNKK